MAEFDRIESTVNYTGKIYEDRTEIFKGFTKRDGIFTQDGVHIFAVTPSQNVLFVRQPRHVIRQYTMSLPAGFVDPMEAAMDAGIRELREETGWLAKTLIRLYDPLFVSPAITNQRAHLYLALDLEWSPAADYEKTHLDVRYLPLSLMGTFLAGEAEIVAMPTVLAILQAQKYLAGRPIE